MNKLNPFPWKCQQELRFDDDDMLVGYLLPLDSRVLWIGVCLISPRRAGKHYCQLRYIGGLSKETGKRQKREVPLLFSGVTGCTKTSSVDNCYSPSFISVFEAEHEDL